MKVKYEVSLKNNITSNKMKKAHNKNKKSSKHAKHDSLSPSFSKISSSKNQENTFKDSLEGSISESKTNLLIPDSLNNTKSSLAITGILKNKRSSKNMKTEKNMHDHKIHSAFVINKEKSTPQSIDKNQIIINNNKIEPNEKDTKKIDYRYYTNYPFKDISDNRNQSEVKLFWFATYDKLIKKKKLLKILNYYSEINININNIDYITDESIKEQLLIIKDFDIYFEKQSNKPIIKKINGGYIFVKLYLLTLEQINQVLNYINRFKFTLSYNNIKNLQEKGSYQILFNNYKNFPYNIIYHMGNFMNTNIYAFSKLSNNNYSNLSEKSIMVPDYLNQKFPNSRTIAKLVKLLLIHFPKYTSDFFICYLLSKIKFENFNEKSNEIKTIIYSKSNIQTQNIESNNEIRFNNTLFQASFSPFSLSSNPVVKEDFYKTKKKLSIPFTENKTKSNNDSSIKKTNKLENGLKKVKEENENKKKSNYQVKSINSKTIKKNITYKNNNILMKKKNISTIFTNTSADKKNYNKERRSFNVNNINHYKSSVISSNENLEKKIKLNQPIENKIEYKKTFKKLGKSNLKEFEKKVIKQVSQDNQRKSNNNKNCNFESNKSIINNNIMTSKAIYTIITNNKNKINNKKKEEKKKNKFGIYVVSRRIKTEIQDDNDDSSLLINKNRTLNEHSNSGDSVFITPQKKRKYKYYS